MIWPHLVCIKRILFIRIFDSTLGRIPVAAGRAERARRVLVCLRFEGVDRKEAAWKGLQTEVFLGKRGREQIEKRERERERSCVQAEGLASSLRSRAEICPT